ncbi:MAG TPA: TOMM precursor leader peptide-binding protein, partial [Streptomyces sp.]
MTLDTAVRPAPVPEQAPLESAGRDLERRLTLRAARDAAPAPRVAVIGAADVLGEPSSSGGAPSSSGLPAVAHRATATVHLTADAVLVGPWGGAPDAAPACGGCLAIRWQRLRTRTEREALETGLARSAAGRWPVLPDWTVDAVWSLCQLVLGGARPGAGEHGDGLPRVTRLDLETGQVGTVPLLADPLCPHTDAAAEDEAGVGLEPRPKPAPEGYRLRTPASYGLPTAALANPVCGVLGAGTWSDVTSPTTAPVAGSVFMRGYAGLTDVTWSGQSNS